MNVLLTLSLLLGALIVSLGVVLTIRKRRATVKRLAGHRPLRRFQQHIPGITPLILRASRPRRVAHPPIIQVLPQAIAPSSTAEEQQMARKQAASQTTMYALPLSYTVELSSCPKCSKQTSAHDIFCGACGTRLHRAAPSHE
jgi:hypothetical protein